MISWAFRFPWSSAPFNVMNNKLMQNTKSDKSLLIKKILSIIGENYENYCYKHDGCRVLQGCLKYGSKEQRNKIIESLMPFLFKIICGKYSIYLGNKIFKYSDNEQKKKILEDIIKPNFINLLKYSGGITFTKTVFMYSNTNYQDELIDLYIKENERTLGMGTGQNETDVYLKMEIISKMIYEIIMFFYSKGICSDKFKIDDINSKKEKK